MRRPGRAHLTLIGTFACATVTVMVAGVSPVSAQQAASNRTRQVYTANGDKSTLKEVGGQRVLELVGNVKVVHNDVTVTSDRGLHYQARELTRFVGNVIIRQQTLTMWADDGQYFKRRDTAIMRNNVRIVDEGWQVTCDEARYNRSTGDAILLGNVVAKDSTTTVRADSLLYNRDSQVTEAFGNVRITNMDEGFMLEGHHGFYYRQEGEAIVDDRPHLTVDPDSPEPVSIDSDTMRVYPDADHAVAYYTVKIIKGNMVTQCDSAAIFDAENRAELYGNPLAKQDNVSMSGGTMILHYNDEEVYRVDLVGAASMREAQKDSLIIGRDSWVKGDTLTMFLSDNRVDSLRVLGQASSEYYPANPNKVESNYVVGDSMFFRFEADTLEYVRIMGKADGKYRFLDLGDGETSDSLRAVLDTNLTFVPFAEKAQDVVYSARRIEYYAKEKDLVLNETASIEYQGNVLSGKDITYFSDLQLLDARGEPQLTDEGETFYGERMNYDMESKAGLVHKGSTQFGEGYYSGENVAKVGEKEMKVWQSHYTTCDLAEPHFHFSAKEMKVYPQEKVISGPIWLYVGKTPIAYLPFLYNDIRRGRRSGILRPDFEFGVTSRTGRYIRDFGYYWATNDYTDFTFKGDFNEDSSFLIQTYNRYKLRYVFDGNVDFRFFRDLRTFGNKWTLDARHQHKLGDRFNFSSDIHFVSDDTARRDISRIDDVDRFIDRSLRSNVTLSKHWDRAGFSASATRKQFLDVTDPDEERIGTVLPNLNLSIPSLTLWWGEKSRTGQAGLAERVLDGIRLQPGLSARRTTSEKEFDYTETITSDQSLTVQSPQNIGPLTLTPRLSASNAYTRRETEFDARTIIEPSGVDTIPPDTTFIDASREVETDSRFTWNMGANASTKIFGTFYPNVGRLRGIRHTIVPSANYRFTPEIDGRPRSQLVGLSLQNTIDLKVAKPTVADTTAEEGEGVAAGGEGEEDLRRLAGVLIWTTSTTYNPQAPRDVAWGDISSRVNTRLWGANVSMTQRVDPYDLEILSTSITSGFGFGGTHPFGRSKSISVRELNVVAAADTSRDAEGAKTMGGDGDAAGALGIEEGRLPWSVNVQFSYNRFGDSEPRSTMNLGSQVSLTDAWRVDYSTSYDIEAREFREHRYSIYRDLHCWEMSFNRIWRGDEWQFYFKISLRAHPEIYAEQGRRGLGGGGSIRSTLGL